MISKSPDRYTFQLNNYIKRCEEKGEEPSDEYTNLWKSARQQDEENMSNPEWQKDNLEYDLRTTPWILEKARTKNSYAQNVYAALCNMQWCRVEVIPYLRQDPDKDLCTYSWRYAGGIVADMLQRGDYIDWYCSGIGGINAEYDAKETPEEWQKRTGYVPEGVVTEEIERDFFKLGWVPVPYSD